MNLQEHIPLAPFTTFHIGGPARFFILAQTTDEVIQALAFARERSLPLFVLGGGSNILVADNGFDGLVLAVRIPGITSENRDGYASVTAGAGVVWDELVAWAVRRGFAGFECLSGIPGTVGGAVIANVGAYGAQCSDTFVSAEALDLHDANGVPKVLTKDECRFTYHDSLFCREPGRYLVVRATFALPTNGAPRFAYKDNRFDLSVLATKNGRPPTLANVRNMVLDVREQKGNLIMEDRVSYKGAGSFFHMPFVSPQQYEHVKSRARALDAEKEERLRPWAWEQPDGSYKLAPGFLLEYTEFQKGHVRGAVGISPKHTLAIINVADARASDVAGLARDMCDAIEKIFGVRLEREVKYVGFE